MNTASKQLCQELYELSGWNCVRDWYFAYHKAAGEVEYDLKLNADESKAGRDDFPAYDVGYLLRKLPRLITDDVDSEKDLMVIPVMDDGWSAFYEGAGKMMSPGIADNPEDAACRLAIELFKQGILKPSKGGTDS